MVQFSKDLRKRLRTVWLDLWQGKHRLYSMGAGLGRLYGLLGFGVEVRPHYAKKSEAGGSRVFDLERIIRSRPLELHAKP
jgi:hypothetical protein